MILLSGCEPGYVVNPKEQVLVWQDEFEGNAVDTARWTFETGNNNGWGNQEKEYYRVENTGLRPIPGETGRALVITAKQESFGGQSFTSSRLKTQGKASWTYGRIEARMRLPEGQGIWPAFWMLGESIASVGWPKSGEIDIMEMVGGSGVNADRNKTTHGTAHWWNTGSGHLYNGDGLQLGSNLSAGYHVYSIDWTAKSIAWSVDGQQFFSQSITGAEFSEFHEPQFLLLNLAVGGQWPGSPDGTTVFPQEFWIDWIRVYQKQ